MGSVLKEVEVLNRWLVTLEEEIGVLSESQKVRYYQLMNVRENQKEWYFGGFEDFPNYLFLFEKIWQRFIESTPEQSLTVEKQLIKAWSFQFVPEEQWLPTIRIAWEMAPSERMLTHIEQLIRLEVVHDVRIDFVVLPEPVAFILSTKENTEALVISIPPTVQELSAIKEKIHASCVSQQEKV